MSEGATHLGYAHSVIAVELGIEDHELALVDLGGQFDGASVSAVVAALDPAKT